MTRLEILQKTESNIFTTSDLMVLWGVSDRRDVIESVKDYIRRERIFSIRKGIYALNKEYDVKELAQKLISPSYISYYTALAMHGIIFQKYAEIHSFAIYSKTILLEDQKFIYHKMSEKILYIQEGIVNENHYTVASSERAICDSLYLNKTLAFDNLRNIDVDKLKRISLIYENKRLEANIKKLVKQIQSI